MLIYWLPLARHIAHAGIRDMFLFSDSEQAACYTYALGVVVLREDGWLEDVVEI